MGGAGRAGSRLFMSSSFDKKNNGENRLQSHNLIAKQISFSSPLSKDIIQGVQFNSNPSSKANQQAAIREADSEDDVSEKSDPSSSENDSDSSIEAALNGEEETEDSIYNKILASQANRENGIEEESKEQDN